MRGTRSEVKTRTDIIDVHPIIPQTVTWEYEERGVDTVPTQGREENIAGKGQG